ncbi:hypothetical protein BKA64DRAFT_773777 [Cadophora sp. MPI-SDFR-AT-0126]|nr:hypothetical protein BKA64DRAFT_773777 [Leotiomycetes sp. MPI-SDFR-AT-0126]
MTTNSTNSGNSRPREILDEADWRQRAAPLAQDQQADFNVNAFPNAPWYTIVPCDNPERLPCPPGPWSHGADTISRQEFCCYLHNNGYDDVREVIDITERQFAAHFKAPVEARSLGKLRPVQVPAVPAYDAPQDLPPNYGAACHHPSVPAWRPVSPVSLARASMEGGGSSAPVGLNQIPGRTSQQRSSGIISPGISQLPATIHSPGCCSRIRARGMSDQRWRALEPVSTVQTFPPAPLKTTSSPGPDTLASPSERSSTSDVRVPVDLQHTIDNFKSYIAQQMAADVIYFQEAEEARRGDLPSI